MAQQQPQKQQPTNSTTNTTATTTADAAAVVAADDSHPEQQQQPQQQHLDRWCREVSRQPYQQFLRSHPHYQRLRPEHRQSLSPPTAPLLKHKAPEHLGKVTLLLDLEGTLLACRHLADGGTTGGGGDDWTGWEAMQRHQSADLILLLPETRDSFKRHKYAVYKRPGLDAFLAGVACLGFECVAYSTATLQLARSLVAQVDRDGVIGCVLARKACTWAGAGAGDRQSAARPLLFKDINAVGRDPARAVLVDDWPLGCANPENLLQVPSFSKAAAAEEWRLLGEVGEAAAASGELPLARLLAVLEQLARHPGDVRDFLAQSACVADYRMRVAAPK